MNDRRNNRAEGLWVGLFGTLAVVLILATAGCDFEKPTCVRDSECDDNFICSSESGFCEPDWDNFEPDGDSDDDSSEEDAGREDTVDTEPDSTEEDTIIDPSACVGEPDDTGCFARYEPNDSKYDAHALTASAFGCAGEDGELRELDTVKTDGLCGQDSADFYELEYVECREQSFRIDVVVDPFSDHCPLEAYALNIEIGDRTYRCSEQGQASGFDARCTLLSDGGRQLTVFIDDQFQPSINFASIVVESTAENGSAYFDYDMRVRLY